MTSYWFWADQFLMAQQAAHGELWLVNNFININYAPDWMPGGIYFANSDYRNKMVEFYDCPFLIMQKILFDSDKCVGGRDIVDVIIEQVDCGRFVLLMADRFYLNRGFLKESEHQLLIHGYDLDEQQFFYADNSNAGKFATGLQCSFTELRKAFHAACLYLNEPDFSNSIFTFGVDHASGYELNIPKIIHQLRQYIKETRVCFMGSNRNGIGVYDCLLQYFREPWNDAYDVRGLCVIRDHVSAMIYRVQYLEKYFGCNFESLNLFVTLKQKCDILVTLYLKYGITRERNIMAKIMDSLTDIGRIERKAVEILIAELENRKREL